MTVFCTTALFRIKYNAVAFPESFLDLIDWIIFRIESDLDYSPGNKMLSFYLHSIELLLW